MYAIRSYYGATIGELHHALKAGLMQKSDVYAELGEVVVGEKSGRTSMDEIIILRITSYNVCYTKLLRLFHRTHVCLPLRSR